MSLKVDENEIELKANELQQLKSKIYNLEQQLKNDLIQLDKDAFNGSTWHEFLASINETIQVNDEISIKRETYRLTGTFIIDENVTLTVNGNIYFNDESFASIVHYRESGRYVDGVPKKYQQQFEELKTEMKRFKFERPSDKYVKQLRLSSF